MAKFTAYNVGDKANPFRLMGDNYDAKLHALVRRSPNQKMWLKVNDDLVGFTVCRDGKTLGIHGKDTNCELEVIKVEEIPLDDFRLCLPAELIPSDGIVRVPKPLLCHNLRQAWELSDEYAEPFILLPPNDDRSGFAHLVRLNKIENFLRI